MSSNNEMGAEGTPLLVDPAALDDEALYAGAPFTGLILRRVAQVTEPTTLLEAASSFGLSGHCMLLIEGRLIPFFIAGAQTPAPAQANESITQQRLAFSMQREAALQSDLSQARDDIFRARQEHLTEMAALYDERRRAEDAADTKLRKVKAELLDATHGDRPQVWETAMEKAQEMLPTLLNWLGSRQGSARPTAFLPSSVAASNGEAARWADSHFEEAPASPDTVSGDAVPQQLPPELELMQWVVEKTLAQIGRPPDEAAMNLITETVEANRKIGVKMTIEHAVVVVYYLSARAVELGADARDVLAIFEPLLHPYRKRLLRFEKWTGRRMASTLFDLAGADTESPEGKEILAFAAKVFDLARKKLREGAD